MEGLNCSWVAKKGQTKDLKPGSGTGREKTQVKKLPTKTRNEKKGPKSPRRWMPVRENTEGPKMRTNSERTHE